MLTYIETFSTIFVHKGGKADIMMMLGSYFFSIFVFEIRTEGLSSQTMLESLYEIRMRDDVGGQSFNERKVVY